MTSFLIQLVQNTPVLYLKKKAKLLAFLCLSFIVQSNAQTWTQLSPPGAPFPGSVLGIHFVDKQTGYVCGDNGRISKTNTCGNTWQAQVSGTINRLYSICFTDAANGVAVGDDGAVRRTTTGGLTWTAPVAVPANFATYDFRRVWFLDSDYGYIVGGDGPGGAGVIFRTKDKGANWENITPATNNGNGIYGVFFTDRNNGYATNFDGRIFETTNGNASTVTWNSTKLTTNSLFGIHFSANGLIGFAVGGNISTGAGVILKKTGTGPWAPVPTSPGLLSDVKLLGNDGYAVGGNPLSSGTGGTIYKITNFGLISNSWNLQATGIGSFQRLTTLSWPSVNYAYASGLAGTILKTPADTTCCTDCTGFQNSFNNANFNYTATPPSSLYTFTPPSGTVSGDVFSWDFGDGNTSAASSPQNTYQSAGTYLVSLCIQRPQPNGDTCKVKLCQQIVVQTCRQCVQYINANPVDLAVDMSAWSSGSGPVTFYPTTSFAPFNVRITWDFNCDGTPDQVTSGNSPVTFNFPCGPKTICYTVECLQSQQVICSTKSFRKTFNIPCPQNQSECPNLVINGDFTAGDNGSFSSPSLAPNCTGACGTGAYCVGDNFKDKCNLWPNSVDHTTGSGNFMSIDGVSGGTGPFQVWKQIAPITVQPNTTYKFCFWVKSVYPFAQQQQLVLESVIKDANGNPLKSMPHPIRQTTPMWTEYCMIWNSGSNTSVQLVIEQTNSGAFRDFGIDDISFCCVDCADFMTDAMDFGIQGTRVSGNTYKFCLSSNISANDIVKWDLDCNGTIDATTHCATFTLTPSNTQICATVYHVNKPGDTCRVKLNTCLPDVVNTDSCTCQSPIFENDVKAGFSWVKNPPYTVTFRPYGLLDKCDKVQWSFGNASAQATSVGNASVSYTYPSTPGSYSVCMFVTRTEPNGTICKREFCLLIKLDGTVGLTEVGLSKLTVNPNPTHNSVSISVPNALFNRKHLLRLTTIDGKVVKSMAIESAEMKMDMEMLPAGLYFLYLSDDKGNVLVRPTKVVKQ
jgi:photosystem II stability/assembly factor-like uncharacterized protein